MNHRLRLAFLPLVLAASTALGDDPMPGKRTLTGKDALGDWTTDAPGVRRKITVDDLVTPYDTPSANNFPRVAPRPEGARPRAPEGFEVTEFATGLNEPRVIVRAPNGDLFLAESRLAAVAGAGPQRRLEGDGPAPGMAEGRAAAGVEGDGARQGARSCRWRFVRDNEDAGRCSIEQEVA